MVDFEFATEDGSAKTKRSLEKLALRRGGFLRNLDSAENSEAGFPAISDSEKSDLADALEHAGGYARKLNDPDYNYVIHSNFHLCSACRCTGIFRSSPYYLPPPDSRWSGIHINPSLPESDASLLKR
jgi:hypothetical protein